TSSSAPISLPARARYPPSTMPGLSDPRAEVVVEEGRHRDQRVLVGEARPPLEERLRQLADVRLARALLLDRPVSDDEDALRRPARQVLQRRARWVPRRGAQSDDLRCRD